MIDKILESRATTLVLVVLAAVFAIHTFDNATESVRLDMTADDLYSLSEGTREILDRMHEEGVEPIELELYYSATVGKSLPRFVKDFITYERYLRALLRELEAASEGKIEVQFLDPKPDSDEAQDALDHGLDGKPVNQHGDLFFFGLAFETQTGSKDKIEFLWPNQQETVEYEIAKRLHGLIWPAKKKIGVISGLGFLSDASDPYMAQILAAQGRQPEQSWIAAQLLDETYELSKIDAEADSISRDDYDLVIVVHPKGLSQKTLWALDEWVVKGGNLLVFVDPYSLDDQPPQNPQQPWAAYQYKPASNLGTLFAAWGLERPEDRIAADFDLAMTRTVTRSGPAQRLLVDLAIDPETADATLAEEHPVLRGLDDLRFFLAGTLVPAVGDDGKGLEGVSYEPLITTTAEGNTLEMKPGFPGTQEEGLVFGDVSSPAKLLDAYREGTEPVALAYLIQGRLPSAFPEGAEFPAETPAPPPGLPPGIELPVPEDAEMVTQEPVSEDQRAEATVMVFADVDFISDQVAFQATPIGALAANDNHKVLLNAVDYLLGSQALMKVRSKSKLERPFTLFDEIEAQADRDTLERERQLRAELEAAEEELREKQASLGERNAALFEKELQDGVDRLDERIQEVSRELRDIRREKRAALEAEEAKIRFTTLWLTPSLVMILGLGLFFHRKWRDRQARRTTR